MTAAVLVDPVAAHEVAAAYLDAPRTGRGPHGPLAEAAYTRLVDESDRLFHRITDADNADRVDVVFTTCPAPYRDADELIESVRRHRLLEVVTIAADPDRRHPLMSSHRGGAFDRFRAVHDVLGHARLRLGFDRHSEFAAWLAQERFHSRLARRALATELHGQHSVLWTTGRYAEPKAVLLDPRLLRRSQAAGLGSGLRSRAQPRIRPPIRLRP